LSGSPLNREELLRDSQATLREVAGVLDELWDLQLFGSSGSMRPDFPVPLSSPGADIEQVLANTQRDVQALQESIGALKKVLPTTIAQGGRRESVDQGPGTAREKTATGASELLAEVQARLDQLAHDIGRRRLQSE